jgi:hypothetical protein
MIDNRLIGIPNWTLIVIKHLLHLISSIIDNAAHGLRGALNQLGMALDIPRIAAAMLLNQISLWRYPGCDSG